MASSQAAWRRPLWLGLLIAVSAALTVAFACVTPLVAIGVTAAMALSRSSALWATLAAWLADQVIGYSVLHYPWTVDSFGWGVALGGAAIIATLTAQWVVVRLHAAHSSIRALAAFVAAFAVYEVGLYAVAVSMLGGTQGFAPPILVQVLVINTVTILGFCGLNQLATAVGLIDRRVGRVSPARRLA
jgi:hypothetical protein